MSAVRHCYSPDAPQTERLAAYLEEKEARVERRKAFARRHSGDTVVQLALNIHLRIVPRAQQIAALPQRHNLFEILLAKNANLHGIPHH